MDPGCDRSNGATSPFFPSWTFRQPGYLSIFLWRRSPWPIGGSRCFSINKFFFTCAPASRTATFPGQVSSGDGKPARSANRPLPRGGLIQPVLCPARRSLPGRLPNGRNRRSGGMYQYIRWRNSQVAVASVTIAITDMGQMSAQKYSSPAPSRKTRRTRVKKYRMGSR